MLEAAGLQHGGELEEPLAKGKEKATDEPISDSEEATAAIDSLKVCLISPFSRQSQTLELRARFRRRLKTATSACTAPTLSSPIFPSLAVQHLQSRFPRLPTTRHRTSSPLPLLRARPVENIRGPTTGPSTCPVI